MKTNNILNNLKKGTTKKIATIAILIFVAIAAGVGGWLIWRSFFSKAAKELPKASMVLEPASGNYKIGEEFTVDVIIDTNGAKAPNTAAYLQFNPQELEVIKVVPNTKDVEGNTTGIFERSWYPRDTKALAAVNKNGWVVIAGLTETKENSGKNQKQSTVGENGTEASGSGGDIPGKGSGFFSGTGKLGTITFKGKRDANAEVKFVDAPSAVMNPLHDVYNKLGQPNKEAANVLKVTKGGLYIIGEGAQEPIPAPVLRAKGGDKVVNLVWEWNGNTQVGTNATFNVYRRIVTGEAVPSNGKYDKIKIGLIEKNYQDTDVVNGTTYEYYVTAQIGNRESDPSNTALATPGASSELPAPINLTARGGNKKVKLAWEYKLDNKKLQYRIYRATIEKTGTGIGGEGALTPNHYKPLKEVKEKAYLDTEVVNGTTYSYFVIAFLAKKESNPSNEASATPTGGGLEVLHADIAHDDGGGNAVYGRDGKVNYFDYAFLMNVAWNGDPANWPDPKVDYSQLNKNGDVVLGSDGKISYPEYAYMLNVEWGMMINK